MSAPGAWPPPSFPGGANERKTHLDALSSFDGPVSAFGAPLARWWQRFGAMVLDALLIGIVSVIVAIPFAHGASSKPSSISPEETILSLAVSAVYFGLLNGIGTGQTLGNRAPGIAVRDAATGAPIGLLRGLLRWLVRTILYAAFLVPGIINDLFPLWDPNRQTLADKVARSVVIRLR